ncbi:MAG: CPBP family intramembrane glutamic endopeptidase [Planctomycetota bacterium]
MGVLPHVISSVSLYVYQRVAFGVSGSSGGTASSYAFALIYQDVPDMLMVVPVTLYFMWRAVDRGQLKWSDFGIVPPKLLRDIALGVGVTVFSFAIWYVLKIGEVQDAFLRIDGWEDFQIHGPRSTPDSFGESFGVSHVIVGTLGLAINSLNEELVCRCYLIAVAPAFFRNPFLAIVVPAFLFGLYHLWYGSFGVVDAFIGGLVYGAVFLKWRSIWPLIVTHTLYNVFVIFGYEYLRYPIDRWL